MAFWGNQARVASDDAKATNCVANWQANDAQSRGDMSLGGSQAGGSQAALPRMANGRERAVLCHPDRQTKWIGVGIVHLTSKEVAKELVACFESRMGRLSELVPLVASRLEEPLRWVPGPPPALLEVAYEPPGPPREMMTPFRLQQEPPLRIGVDVANAVLIITTHHAALDGADTMAVIETLLGKQRVRVDSRSTGLERRAPDQELGAGGALALSRSLAYSLSRVLLPSDPVAPSSPEPEGEETFAATKLPLIGHGAATRLPAACVLAALAHNSRRQANFKRIGITITRGGPPSAGNVASYRRVDIGLPQWAGNLVAGQLGPKRPSGPEQGPSEELSRLMDMLQASIARELSRSEEPVEFHLPSRAMLALVRPIHKRFSDSLLVSYFGRFQAPGARSVEGYSVARGASGISFGALRLVGGESTLTLRALHLSQEDARLLLDDVLWLLSGR
jgi:hypothetical protein